MILDLPSKPISWLVRNLEKDNLAPDLDDNTLQLIGADVVAMYEVDKASRTDWEQKIEAGMKVAKQVVESKTFPWPGAANTKDALMAEAASQFAARAGGEIVRGQDVVKVKVTGDDPEERKSKRAKRVSTYMSFCCTDGMPEWEPENDQLLTSVSLIGMYYKKTYRDPLLGRTVSLARSPMNIVVHEDTRTLDTARRITDDSLLFDRNQVIERVRRGIWIDPTEYMHQDGEDEPEQFFEQHRTLDLDGDGYSEPYIVTVHAESKRVCRIVPRYSEEGIVKGKKGEVARIEPDHYFTEFPFLLSPDGKFHKIGWAHLLGPNTEVVNTIVNQLLDAGTLANCPPVFMGKGGKLPPGGLRVKPGAMIPIESTGQALRDNLFIPTLTGPSDVLFKLLGLLSDRGQKLANLSDSMQGETGGANVPATTTLALLDQALKVYTSILKRLFRSYKNEFQKLYKLDKQWLTDKEYVTVIDLDPKEAQEMGVDLSQVNEQSRIIVEADFGELDRDIQPVMDPTASSEALRLARLNAMAQAAGMPPAVGRLYLDGIGVPQKDIDTIFPPADPNAPPPPNPEMIKIEAEVTNMKHKAEQDDKRIALLMADSDQKEALLIAQIDKIRAEITHIKANSILALANAEKAEVGTQVDVYRAEMETLNQERDQELALIDQEFDAESAEEGEGGADSTGDDTGGAGEMEEPAVNQESAGLPPAEGSRSDAGLVGGELPAGIPGADSGMDINDGGAMPSVQPNVQPGDLPPPDLMQ